MTIPTQPQAAQEQIRQQYLAAMGITPWLPRRQLPGAAPSPQWSWVELDAESGAGVGAKPKLANQGNDSTAVNSGAPTASAAEIQAARAAMAPLRQSLGRKSVAPSPEVVPSPVQSDTRPPLPASSPQPLEPDRAKAGRVEALSSVADSVLASESVEQLVSATSVAKDEVPSFKLALVAYPRCLVITELPVRHAQPWSDQHQQLLNAIVAAIGLAEPGQAPLNYQQFDWPLDRSASYDQSESVARHALDVELTQLRQPEQQAMLLMGQSAARYLLPIGQTAEAGVMIQANASPALCCHGLNEVLRLPGLKSELWRQLQPLRRFVAESSATVTSGH